MRDPEYVDDLLHLLVEEGQATLKRLGFKGTVAVNIEWTDDPKNGYLCIGSKIPDEATPLLAASLRASASNINDEDDPDGPKRLPRRTYAMVEAPSVSSPCP